MKKKQLVWIVNCADTGCEEPGYIAVCAVFATHDAAVRSMEYSVAEDEECLELKAKWDDSREMAIMERGDGRRIVYTLDEMEVRP